MLRLLGGGSHPALLQSVANSLGVTPVQVELAHYPDAEVVRLQESVRDADLFILQSTPPPSERHLFELLLLADAAHRAGAARITAAVPYLGYSRQDRRAGAERTAVGAHVVANMLAASAIQQVVTFDLHQPAIEGFFGIPVEHMEAFPLLLHAMDDMPPDSVIVAPDLGAAKLADRFATALALPMAAVHKTRSSGVDVSATRITGDVRGLRPIIVDDMISTGRTIQVAIGVLAGAGCVAPAVVAATHAIFSPDAPALLSSLGLERLVLTDSVPIDEVDIAEFRPVTLAFQIADAIRRLHEGKSLRHLRSHR